MPRAVQILLIPLAIMFVWWFISHSEVGFSWVDVMDYLNVQNRERYTRLAVWGVCLIGVALAWRLCRTTTDDDG